MPEIYYWAQLFKATTWEETQMLAEKNESIKKSIVTLKELTADEQAKMQMEARERYRRDMIVAEIFGREQSEEEIRALKDDLQKVQEESIKKDEHIRKVQEESIKKDERIRFLEEQLTKANKK